MWNVYTNGTKKERSGTIHLWSIIFLLMLAGLFSGKSEAYSFEAKINNQITLEETERVENIELQYSKDNQFVLAQVEFEKDWWENLKVGRKINSDISWLSIDKPPSEQAILSAKFIDVQGWHNPLVEVYGLTHPGHGNLYIYEIKNDTLRLLFTTKAVDENSDIRWAPENYKKYGYGNCGEIFSGGKLVGEYGEYTDINKDGVSDIILRGTKEIVCETKDGFSHRFYEVKVAENKIEEKFLWDKNEQT